MRDHNILMANELSQIVYASSGFFAGRISAMHVSVENATYLAELLEAFK